MKRKLFTAFVLTVLLCPLAFGSITLGTVEEFTSGLGDWSTSGDVVYVASETGFARLGFDSPTSNGAPTSTLSNTFVVSFDGTYQIQFDYRFAGHDTDELYDDAAFARIIGGTTFLSLSTPGDLTGTLTSPGSFTSLAQDVSLTTGITYTLEFRLEEANSGLVSTVYDIDNVYISSREEPPVIPAPGSVLLCSIGVALVGWLRRRRTMA